MGSLSKAAKDYAAKWPGFKSAIDAKGRGESRPFVAQSEEEQVQEKGQEEEVVEPIFRALNLECHRFEARGFAAADDFGVELGGVGVDALVGELYARCNEVGGGPELLVEVACELA